RRSKRRQRLLSAIRAASTCVVLRSRWPPLFHHVFPRGGAVQQLTSQEAGNNSRSTDLTPLPLQHLGWHGLAFSRVAQNENAPLLVGDVDIAGRVDEHVFRLGHELVIRQRAVALGRGWRNEPTDLLRQPRVLDVVGA